MRYKGACVMSQKFLKNLALYSFIAVAMLTTNCGEKYDNTVDPNSGNGVTPPKGITAEKEINVGSISAGFAVATGTIGADSGQKIGTIYAFDIVTGANQKISIAGAANKTINVTQIGLDKITQTSNNNTIHFGANGEEFSLIIESIDLNNNGQIDASEAILIGTEKVKKLKANASSITFNRTSVVAGNFTSAHQAFKNSEKVHSGSYIDHLSNNEPITQTGFTIK